MSARRISWIVGSLVLVVAVVIVSLWLFNQKESTAKPQRSVKLGTARIVRGDLAETLSVPGKLSYGDPISIETLKGDAASPASTETSSDASGEGGDDTPPTVVTWLPAVGATIHRGEVLFRINAEPVTLLYGDLPAWRDLDVGAKGEDVKQFESNLAALGYRGITVDEQFTEQTKSAVKQWQKKLQTPDTGVVKAGDVIFQPDEVRIAEVKAKRGGRAAGEILTVTSTKPTVVIDLDVNNRSLVNVNAKVTVDLPDGESVQGTVTQISSSAQQLDDTAIYGPDGQNEGPVTVPVTISLDDPEKAKSYEQAPVSVQLITDQQHEVLIVPVTALLSKGDGKFAVAVLAKGKRRVISVQTGMFADGQVEISGSGLKEGMAVEVPES